MSDSPITTRLPLPMLTVLVPDGSTLADAWVVLVGHREHLHTTPDGRPVYGDIVGWAPVLPVADQQAAVVFAERLGVASLGVDPDQWLWYPATDDNTVPLSELFGVVDGDEVCPEVAVAPLTALLRDEPEQAPEVSHG